MYFDEDGDLAHEFYEEVLDPRDADGDGEVEEEEDGVCRKRGRRRGKGGGGGLVIMRRVSRHRLRPQGEVKYPHPRLHVDVPIILYQG